MQKDKEDEITEQRSLKEKESGFIAELKDKMKIYEHKITEHEGYTEIIFSDITYKVFFKIN